MSESRAARTMPSLNGFQLKLLALALMTVDHIAAYHAVPMSEGVYNAMRVIGRAAAPLFLFMVTEGLRHTHSRGRYLMRLYLNGVLLSAANAALSVALGRDADIGNIFPTFFYVVLFANCIDALRARPRPGRALAALGAMALPFGLVALYAWMFSRGQAQLWWWLRIVLPSPLGTEYSILFVLLGLGWYYLRDRRACTLLFVGASLVSLLVPYQLFTQGAFPRIPLFHPQLFTAWHMFTPTQWCMILALPAMLCYNGERGRAVKRFFYAYYMLHQIALFLLGLAWT